MSASEEPPAERHWQSQWHEEEEERGLATEDTENTEGYDLFPTLCDLCDLGGKKIVSKGTGKKKKKKKKKKD